MDIIIPKSTAIDDLLKSMSSIQANMCIKDSNGHYSKCNQHMVDFVGKSFSHELDGTTDLDLSWRAGHELYRAHDQQVIKNNKTYYLLEPALNDKNELIRLFAIKAPLSKFSSDIPGLVSVNMSLDNLTFKLILSQFLEITEKLKLDVDPGSIIRLITHVMQLKKAHSQWKHNKELFDYGTIRFTFREAQCLHFFLNNYSAEKTSKQLHISRKTVECHIARIKVKLQCKDRTEITNKAIDDGFIELMFMKF